MEIHVFTLFPEWFEWFVEQRHIKNLLANGLSLEFIDLRATTPISNARVDDTPYGGGAGMVIRVDVVAAALENRYEQPAETVQQSRRVIVLSPTGKALTDPIATDLAADPAITLLCGRYEGFDERVHERFASDVVSVGDYVLSGGELAAMTVIDAFTRKIPGALGDEHSAIEESFSAALGGAPEYPHYTRPVDFRGAGVPDVLLSGDHGEIAKWRAAQSNQRASRRADQT